MVNEMRQRKTNTLWLYLHVELKKNKRSEHKKTETKLSIQRINRWLPAGREVGEEEK